MKLTPRQLSSINDDNENQIEWMQSVKFWWIMVQFDQWIEIQPIMPSFLRSHFPLSSHIWEMWKVKHYEHTNNFNRHGLSIPQHLHTFPAPQYKWLITQRPGKLPEITQRRWTHHIEYLSDGHAHPDHNRVRRILHRSHSSLIGLHQSNHQLLFHR